MCLVSRLQNTPDTAEGFVSPSIPPAPSIKSCNWKVLVLGGSAGLYQMAMMSASRNRLIVLINGVAGEQP